MKLIRLICFVMFTVLCAHVDAFAQEVTLQDLEAMEASLAPDWFQQDRDDQILLLSEKFLDTPYGSVCGEGQEGYFDQRPMACFEKVDCVTFVESVVALTHTFLRAPEDLTKGFMSQIQSVRYFLDDQPSYFHRNHFPTVDWLPSLEHKAYIEDITRRYAAHVETRTKMISKRDWYRLKTQDDLHCKNIHADQVNQRLDSLRHLGEKTAQVIMQYPYVPTERLLENDAAFLHEIFDDAQADVLLVSTVRGEHTQKYLQNIITHHGFLIRNDDGFVIRHASYKHKKVTDEDFVEYMKWHQTFETWPVLGFHFAKFL